MIEAYKIGVSLALNNQVSGALGVIARDFNKTEASAQQLKKTLGEIKLLAVAGAVTLGAGMLGLHALKAPLEEAKKFEQQLAKFKLFGLGDQVTQEAAAYAKAMNVMGSSATENMRLMNEAQGVFREGGLSGSAALEGAKLSAPMLAKINFATESLDEESKARMRTQAMSMLRFVEMRGGLKDAGTFNSIADSGWKAIQSSGGNINWEQLRQFMARGGVAAQGLTNEALFGKMEPVIGELKGSTAGNAWMTSYNRLVGGVKVPNQVAHMLAENGIWDESKIEWNSMGGIKQFKGNPLKDASLFGSDPVEFYKTHIMPMYAAMNGGKGLDVAERGRENTLIFGRTGGAMFSLIDRQMATIERSVEAQKKALGIDASTDVANQTLNGKEVDLQAKWNDLLRELGEAILPSAISAASGLIDGLKVVTKWMREHETATRILVQAFAGLSVLAVIGGSLLLFTAAIRGLALVLPSIGALTTAIGWATGLPALIGRVALGLTTALRTLGAVFGIGAGPIGWIILGITAVVTAAYEVWKHWDVVKPALIKVWGEVGDWFDGLVKAVSDGMAKMWSWIKSLPGDFMSWIKNPPSLSTALGMPKGTIPHGATTAGFVPDYLKRGSVPAAQSGNLPSSVAPPPAASQKITVENTINLDGRTVAKSTSDHFYDLMNKAPSSLGGFDGRMSFTPSALASSP